MSDVAGVPTPGSARDLSGWQHVYSGKVRDLYVPDTTSACEAGTMLVVASDRVSAFDVVLDPAIPGKGALLTKLSLWWFEQLDFMPNHLQGAPSTWGSVVPAEVLDRAMLVRSLDMLPVECVVRGYLTGSGWVEYQQHGTVCGIPLPAGLNDGDRLPEPLYTPAWKAPQGEHDENISFERTIELVGEARATELRDRSLQVYQAAADLALERGLILADTKFEFGVDPVTDELTLADEVLTSDSSRYWDAEVYATAATAAERMASFDKQVVRNWLAANWDKQGEAPRLPDEIVAKTTARYQELIDRLVG